jgi:hypothetical protein
MWLGRRVLEMPVQKITFSKLQRKKSTKNVVKDGLLTEKYFCKKSHLSSVPQNKHISSHLFDNIS